MEGGAHRSGRSWLRFRLSSIFWITLVVASFFCGKYWHQTSKSTAPNREGRFMFGVDVNSDAGVFTMGLFLAEQQAEIQGLIQSLKVKDLQVRNSAVDALVRIGPSAIPALIDALKDEDAGVRAEAAYTIGEIGTPAKEAAPALTVALKDEHGLVRRLAAEALRTIDPSTK